MNSKDLAEESPLELRWILFQIGYRKFKGRFQTGRTVFGLLTP